MSETGTFNTHLYQKINYQQMSPQDLKNLDEFHRTERKKSVFKSGNRMRNANEGFKTT